MTAGYSGTPLARKLGIAPESRLLLLGAPEGFAVPDLPPGVAVHRRPGREPYGVALLFVTTRRELERRFLPTAGRLTRAGGLWVCWPKGGRKAAVPTDLDENLVRDVGLAAGLVDNKVAAVDAVWSGLRFVVRLRDRA
jgi:hypothetical protein